MSIADMAQEEGGGAYGQPSLPRRIGGWFTGTGRFMRRKPLGAVGLIIVLIFVAAAVLAPWVGRYDPEMVFQTDNPDYKPNPTIAEIARNPDIGSPTVVNQFEAPSGKHWFGTDAWGRDIYAHVIHGARLSLIVGLGASFIAVFGGLVMGMISAYYAGFVDLVMQRIIDMLQAIPFLILVLTFTETTGERSVAWVVIWLGIGGLAITTRLIRAGVLAVRESEFVMAARVVGANDLRIMLRHVVPNIAAVLLITFSIGIGAYILVESTLSFLGVGPQGLPSWGRMVADGRAILELHPWLTVFSGISLTMIVLGFNLFGDALRDVLDPRLRGA